MSKELVISASSHERRVAILEEGQLVEIYIEREKEFALVGSIYKGKVTRVLPGMQSAFVDIGLDGDAFLYVSDVFENLEDYDHGHGHDHVQAPQPIAGGAEGSTIELLPGESLAHASSPTHEENHGGEPHPEAAGDDVDAQPRFDAPTSASEDQEPAHLYDERQPESNASAPQNFSPQYNPTQNYPSRQDRGDYNRGNDRGGDFNRGGDRGGEFNRGDRGGDRGRGGRWGRRGGRRRGGRPQGGPGGGRNLPPSKYASPQGSDRDNRGSDSRGNDNRGYDRGGYRRGGGYERRDNRPYENQRGSGLERGGQPSGPVSGEDEVLLPGESLAKYRGRPAASAPPPVTDRSEEAIGMPMDDDSSVQPRGPVSAGTPVAGPRRFSGSLPRWLLSDAGTESESAAPEHEERAISDAAASEPATSEIRGEDLSDDQVAALSSALVEAKHEETQDRVEVEAVTQIGGAEFDEDDEEGDEELEAAGHSEAEEAELHDEGHDEEEHGDEEEHEDEESLAEVHAADAHEEETGEDEEGDDHRSPRELAEAEADAAHEEAEQIAARGEGEEHHDAEAMGAAAHSGAPSSFSDEDQILLPGETRAPHTGPREEFTPRDSARIGGNPRSRFQRPFRGGGRDRGGRGDFSRGGDRGGDFNRGGRRDGRGGRSDRRGGGRRFDRRGPGGGGHHHRGHHHSGPPRRPQLISEMLKAGQDVVVQIAKEPLGKKGARITSHVALPGRFLVYMPTIDHIGVSRKIASAENRSRLRRLVGEARGAYPGGFIVRTAAGAATDEEIRTDIEFLGKTWNEIKQKNDDRKAPALLHRDLNLVERILRDYVSDDFTAIWIDNEEEYGKVVEFVSRFQPKLANRVKLYTKDTPIFEEFGIQHELDKALRAKVWLKSGGYIVINHTEALVAIDVNTGKFVGKGSTRLEDTIVKTNLEAVKEIVRQIRLRDLGGIIVVDFIDMEERRNREKVLGALQQALEQDKAPSKALSFNEFGLVCITRKRTKQALERVLCQPCPSCTGSGMVKSIPTLCYEIQAEARKMAVAPEHEGANLTLRVHPEIAKALKTRESMLIDELEQNAHKHVIIQSDPTLHWEQYDIY
jgi:Rne/Rng family ribonuclease